MDDELFPSGEWTGFYHYSPADKHRMDLNLEFSNQLMTGEGCDGIGTFLVKGRYDLATKECHFTKSYVGAHSVFYQGFREGKGIWGRWEIEIFAHGGFHIWPRRMGSADESVQAEAIEAHEEVGKGLLTSTLQNYLGRRSSTRD